MSTIHTANILGIFQDPFEFEGDYGPEINPIRQKVFDLVMEESADSPTLGELITPDLIQELTHKQEELQSRHFTESIWNSFLQFIENNGNTKTYRFFRRNSSALLCLDKILRDQAARKGRDFDLPILGSTQPLIGQNAFELKRGLLHALFTKTTFRSAKPAEKMQKCINNRELDLFCTPAGQTFYYWAYQSLILHLISSDSNLIGQINRVKTIFAQTLGNPQMRAKIFREKLMAADSGVVFTQESDTIVPQTLLADGLFLPMEKQNLQDGCFVFLRSDLWEPDYEIVPIEGYEGYTQGHLNVVLATQKGTGDQFLLASCHGNSTEAEDGRTQVRLVMEKFCEFSQRIKGLQVWMGTDANTKSEEDVNAFAEQLEELGLQSTTVGPTTVKRRMVTVQHSKAGRFVVDTEDYLIALKPENGGRFELTHQTVGFKEEAPDIRRPLPNIDNLSDHYPIGARLEMV